MAEIDLSRHLTRVRTGTSEPKCTETASEIEEEATVWAAKADRGQLTPEDQSALERWLDSDSRRAGAYARALAVNAYFDRAAALGPGFSPAEFEKPDAPRPTFDRRKFLWAGGVAIAASAVGVAGYGVVSAGNAIVTAKGDMRRVTLAEGSAITLNTDSRVDPRIEERLRQVHLVKGEALFDVSRDRIRPFVVHVGDVRIRVLGTSFSVRRFDDGSVEVSVLEGVVEVGIESGSQSQRLTSGQRSRIFPQGAFQTESVPHMALERSVGWRRGLIDLNGMTLADAVAEYARYSDRRIEFSDPAIGAMEVTGIYSTSDPLGFARAAALSLDLRAEPTANGMRLQHR
jgi:transmembrane sensor